MADTRWRPINIYELNIYMDIGESSPVQLFQFTDITKDSFFNLIPIQQTTSGGGKKDIAYEIQFNAIIAKNSFEDYDGFFERIANNEIDSIDFKLQAETSEEYIVVNSSGLSDISGLSININIIKNNEWNSLQIGGGFVIPATSLNSLFTNYNWD